MEIPEISQERLEQSFGISNAKKNPGDQPGFFIP
jgi:hypothetical protein